MKTKLLLVLAVSALFFTTACKKDEAAPKIAFTNNATEGTADANGNYILTGHISSQAQIDKVTLTQEGQSAPFMVDESTAKNKTEYDFVYEITGITANTTIVMDVYDQEAQKTTTKFLIRK